MEIICPFCGWRNEPTARMCGGCGQPLHTPISAPVDPEAITEPDLRRAMPIPGGAYAGDRARTRPALPPATPPSRATARQRAGWRLARNVLLALLALGIVGALAWASMVRPALHQRVD